MLTIIYYRAGQGLGQFIEIVSGWVNVICFSLYKNANGLHAKGETTNGVWGKKANMAEILRLIFFFYVLVINIVPFSLIYYFNYHIIYTIVK